MLTQLCLRSCPEFCISNIHLDHHFHIISECRALHPESENNVAISILGEQHLNPTNPFVILKLQQRHKLILNFSK